MLVLIYLVLIITVVYYGFGERFSQPKALTRLPGLAHEFSGDKDKYLTGNKLYLDNRDFAFVCDFKTKVPQGILFFVGGNVDQYWTYLTLYFSVGDLYLSWFVDNYSMATYLIAKGLTDGQRYHMNLIMTPNHPNKVIFVVGEGDSKVKTMISTSEEPEKILGSRIYLGGAPWNLPLDVLKRAGAFTGSIANVFFQTKGKLIANLNNFA